MRWLENLRIRFFPRPYVKRCRWELLRIQQEWGGLEFNQYIRPMVAPHLWQRSRSVREAEQEGWSPRRLILFKVRNQAGNVLASGELHTYRGVLSLEGKDVQRLFNKATRAMVEEGFLTKNEADEDAKSLARAIKEVG